MTMTLTHDPLMAECPFVGYPTGWFIAAWSQEIGPGEIQPRRYFGTDLVVWRSDSGRAVVMDAHCAHMGCNLAHGATGRPHENGLVVGDSVQCPFHGWRWDTDGRNVEIPGCDRTSRVRMRTWPTREVHDRLILVWHDALGRPPLWEPPGIAELDDPRRWYLATEDCAWRRISDLRLPNVMLLENSVDPAHVKFVHGSEIGRGEILTADGPVFRSRIDLTYRARDGRSFSNGGIGVELWGMGLIVTRLSGIHDIIQVVGITPTDGWNVDARVLNVARRDPKQEHPSPEARAVIDHQLYAIDEDASIFAHTRYRARPPFLPDEREDFRVVRRWIGQFYPPVEC
jgi:3-ketosteroid 9alpha-monooxygenase subunit A